MTWLTIWIPDILDLTWLTHCTIKHAYIHRWFNINFYYKYSRDMHTKLVQYSNGQKEVWRQMVRFRMPFEHRTIWNLNFKKFGIKMLPVFRSPLYFNFFYRNYFIHNGGCVGYQRLNMDDVCAIICRDDIGDTTEADQKAKMLMLISRQMSKSEVLRGKLLAR